MDAKTPKTKVALVDDHVLLRKGLADYIRTLKDYDVIIEASDGRDFIKSIVPEQKPEIVLLDVHMPRMNGYDTAAWLTRNHPEIKILALSVSDGEYSVLRMLRNGAKGYVLKDIDPKEFNIALSELVQKGFYYSGFVTGKLMDSLDALQPPKVETATTLSDRELDFLRFACSEMTYKEIAGKMYLSVRTIDGYRDALFEKLKVKTRVGLVMYAIRSGLVEA